MYVVLASLQFLFVILSVNAATQSRQEDQQQPSPNDWLSQIVYPTPARDSLSRQQQQYLMQYGAGQNQMGGRGMMPKYQRTAFRSSRDPYVPFLAIIVAPLLTGKMGLTRKHRPES